MPEAFATYLIENPFAVPIVQDEIESVALIAAVELVALTTVLNIVGSKFDVPCCDCC